MQAGKLPESKQWSAESFKKLKKIIADEVPEGEYIFRPRTAPEVRVGFKDRRAALERIEQRLDPAKALEGEGEMAKVWTVQASSSPSIEVYEKRLVEISRTKGCAAEDAPYMIRALLFQLNLDPSPFNEQSLHPPKLAQTFLDEEHCPGARGLTDAERIKLKRIRDRSSTPKPEK